MSCVVTRKAHLLQEISRADSGDGPGVEEVVRWCRSCGAVVIDIDVDGRTDPGRVSAMQFPDSARAKQQ